MSFSYQYIPTRINSSLRDLIITDDILYWYPWIPYLKNKNIWLSLATGWRNDGSYPEIPPSGFEYYIISGDSLMFGFSEKIADATDAIAINLTGPLIMSDFTTSKVKYFPYTADHRRINRMPTNWPIVKDIKYKTSALTNRVTQSKAIIFSALKTLLPSEDFVGSLHHSHTLLKNVHGWEMSGNATCDQYTKNFVENWLDKKSILPDDDQVQGSYNNSAYLNSALNFTQESYHYSYMSNNGQNYIEPGPFLTEKTWKCLLSKTAFIPVGQAYSYKWLEQMGLKFDYGDLDLSFDQDSGNLTRIEKIINLISSLTQWSAMDLYEMTQCSSEHNYDHIMSGKFWQSCETFNQPTIDYLKKL